MIYDRICNIRKYLGMNENLDIALSYIADHLEDMPQEIELKGRSVRAFHCSYDTVPEQEAFDEAHWDFADIKIMRKGSERVDVSGIDRLTMDRAEPANDFAAYSGPADLSVVISPDSFLLVLPGDAHKLKIMLDRPEPVTKVVFKVNMK